MVNRAIIGKPANVDNSSQMNPTKATRRHTRSPVRATPVNALPLAAE